LSRRRKSNANAERQSPVCYPFATIWPLSRASVALRGQRRQRERRHPLASLGARGSAGPR